MEQIAAATGCTEITPDDGDLSRIGREIDELVALIDDGRDELVPVLAERLVAQSEQLDAVDDPDAAVEALATAMEWLEGRTDLASHMAEAKVWRARGLRHRNAHRNRDWLAALESASACFAAHAVADLTAGDAFAYAEVLNRRGYLHWYLGEHAAARTLFDRGLDLYVARTDLDREPQLYMWLNKANTLYALSDYAGARDLFERVIERTLDAPEHILDLSAALIGRGNANVGLGDRPAAAAAYEEACRVLGGRTDDQSMINLCKALTNLAGEHQRAGRITEALADQSRAVELMFELTERDTATPSHAGQLADARLHRARILAELGHFDAASDEALEVLAAIETAFASTGDIQFKHTLDLVKKDLGAWERRKPSFDATRCSFCNKYRTDVRRLVTGARAQICNACWETAVDQLDILHPLDPATKIRRGALQPDPIRRCDLCNESARRWFFGPPDGKTICDDCVDLATDVLKEDGILRRAAADALARAPDEFFCSFCGRPRREVRKLISGPRVFICDQCTALSLDCLATMDKTKRAPTHLGCAFCGEKHRVALVAGPNDIHICDACVELCREIVEEEVAKESRDLPLPRSAPPPPVPKPRDDIHCSFCDKPRRELLKLVSGPDVTICDECLGQCRDMLADLPIDPATKQRVGPRAKRDLTCSFCNTHEAIRLINGLGKNICDRCIDLSAAIIAK